MTPNQKDLVRESWSKVLPIQETAAELFYGRLFSEYPEVAPLPEPDSYSDCGDAACFVFNRSGAAQIPDTQRQNTDRVLP